jgi:hypothetical protein
VLDGGCGRGRGDGGMGHVLRENVVHCEVVRCGVRWDPGWCLEIHLYQVEQ